SACLILFFFSSRRRHTRFSRDWSSDVCSSDLTPGNRGAIGRPRIAPRFPGVTQVAGTLHARRGGVITGRHPGWTSRVLPGRRTRSEERRVGKESSDGRTQEQIEDEQQRSVKRR